MVISLSWLRELVDISVDVATLAERLTLAGNEVERIHDQGADFEGVVIAEVKGLRPHPNADKLQLAAVWTGQATVEVVTGATNLSVGDRVPLALEGARLGERRIKRQVFRGVWSQGMLCSPIELGLGEDATGILILDDGIEGHDLHEVYPADTILVLEIKSNRPDLLCHLGIAREVSAIFGVPLKPPAVPSDRPPMASKLTTIEALDGCRRFVGRLIKGVNNMTRPPAWMTARLRSAGVRPISIVVDITNYVMLEMGQPMHAFDFQHLNGGRVVVRRAHEGEELLCLDGFKRLLRATDLVVADSEHAQGLAGIIGGEETAITLQTADVLLEAATWEPGSIRRTARALGLRTEASQRFEKGLSPALALPAIDRAAALIGELAGGKPTSSVDLYPDPLKAILIEIAPDRIDRVLGLSIKHTDAESILERLEFKIERSDGRLAVRPPDFRLDCSIPEDVVEEVGRIYGYDRVPSTLPGERVPVRDLYERQDADEIAREVLAGREVDEAVTNSLISADGTANIRLPAAPASLARITNPMAETRNALRASLLPGLLEALALNARQDQAGARLFEVGPAFWRGKLDRVDEPRMLAVALHVPSGGAPAALIELRNLQAILATVRDRLAIESTEFRQSQATGFHPGRTAEIVDQGEPIGVVGEVHPDVLAQLDLPGRAVAAEVLFDRLTADGRRVPQARPLPRFPGVRRDLTVVIRGKIASNDLVQVIRQLGGYTLRDISMQSEYQGPQVGAGARSLSFRLLYQADDRTLTNDEVAGIQQRIVEGLKQRFGAEVRS